MTVLKAFRLEEELVGKLVQLARKAKRSEAFFVQEALRHFFAEYEDAQMAKERFAAPHTKIISGKDMRKRLGV